MKIEIKMDDGSDKLTGVSCERLYLIIASPLINAELIKKSQFSRRNIRKSRINSYHDAFMFTLQVYNGSYVERR
ncbi:hypothetical protein N644_1609 [Lactiplantibacillus paraplantarum]|nr:hypothetical protein N644_1609 [Lactiplantibacillus paraplantarum]KRL49949.1 hypothetical protein FD48_GL002960 [Lactiplantibacillus paraplantarum DSM 10667]GEO60737.1 hypothetical protein LPA07_10580 [Lactiplantibacillus paraplantarum]